MSMTSGTPQPPEPGAPDDSFNQGVMVGGRSAATYFERFGHYECQELLGWQQSHWMLSTDEFKHPTDPPMGMISQLNPGNSNSCLVLIPAEESETLPLDYREVHQIIQELTFGIFVLNQTPNICLEANYDLSTSCQIPPAYIDTRIGQILVNVDYMMKSLWHGAYFPKDKRTKFSESWRRNLDIDPNGKVERMKPLLPEFSGAGMLDITKDPDYANVYDDLPTEPVNDPEMNEERKFFMSFVEDLSMQMTFFQNHVQQYKDMYISEGDWLVSSVVKVLDDRINHIGYERINTRLQMHEQIIKEKLGNKAEVRRNLYMLKLISFLTPFLIGMRKRMKIPDMSRLLPNLSSDECRTERELPPLLLGPDFKCKNFHFENKLFHLHGGILIDLETDPIEEAPKSFQDLYQEMMSESEDYLSKILEFETLKEQYKIPTRTINGKLYYVMMMEFETFYPQSPHKPLWVRSFFEEVGRLKIKKLPFQDQQLIEQFKKYFGYKKSIKYKTPLNGLKAAAQRGLVIMFMTQVRKLGQASRLSKQDEQGLSLLHHASMNNRPQIITHLLLQSMDINVRRNNIMSTEGQGKGSSDGLRSFFLEICPTSLHVAARCGALDALACLLANYGNILATDQDGWAAIHHAAFFDHEPAIKLMIRKNVGLMELVTKNDLKSTPLLLAASSGGLAAVKCLIRLGADIVKHDTENNNLVTLAALRFHTNVLEHLIEWDHKSVPVWKILVKMLIDPDIKKKDSAVKCLEVLSTSKPDHWQAILDADGIPALVSVLKINNEELQSVAASVICNISEQDPVRIALTKADAIPIIIQLLGSPLDEIQSRAALILSDIACMDDNKDSIFEKEGIAPLVNLLDSEMEDVLANAVNAVRVMCLANKRNQDAVAECGGIPPLVEFLTVNSEILQAGTAAAIAAVTEGNKSNQDTVVNEGAVKPLVDLIKGLKNVTVQVKAANAIEALSENNPRSQKAFLDLDAPKALLKLFKNYHVEVREQGACTLWSLAGNTKTQQKYIAESTTISNICGMLYDSTEKLLHVGCMMAIALGRENIENQNKLAKTDAFQQLIRLLRIYGKNEGVVLRVIKVLGILCVGVAYCNNKVSQKRIAEENAIPILVGVLNNPLSEKVQVEVATSLGCIILSNSENQEKLQDCENFKFDMLLDLLKSKNEEIRLRAGMALTIFAFNNTPKQFAIREAGGIKYSVFEPFINSTDPYFVCYAAFQITVLARVIVDQDQVNLTARGVTMLVEKLNHEDDNVIVLAASLLSSLAHTRAGIPDAMVTTGAIEHLVEQLDSNNDQVRSAVAVAMGYMTFNRTAARLLFSACRNTPGLYKSLVDNIGKNAKISSEFVEDFQRAKIVGLPSQCLEINGGPPVTPLPRIGTAHSRMSSRAKSAPSSGRKKSAFLNVVIGSDSRPSTRSRPISGVSSVKTNKSRKETPSPDGGFKTRLSSWNKK
ncbi:ankyrin and armadillo repeat-containing protein-like isoform X3 [Mizuhopecten yessoensis]|uniref:Ankyrin and armadillo repeat-containing protein n=1 Tax=Mizuhopecten yessoensis TaxID=6573 RepID=A0A210PU51_MIZYE|nr:ankyrin and armadillo repeat-containing protein-like isoform X3 [Mizuhopecten yessoensis]OWF40013.1 Ankyrin and armadillo repeat-containing protein [Mizuhopecten yessoensis]